MVSCPAWELKQQNSPYAHCKDLETCRFLQFVDRCARSVQMPFVTPGADSGVHWMFCELGVTYDDVEVDVTVGPGPVVGVTDIGEVVLCDEDSLKQQNWYAMH